MINGKNDIASEEYSSGSNIVIGGNTLGRGVTFPALHKVIGRKGWDGRELWVPNIKLPHNVVYYDVKEADEPEE